MLVVDLAPRIRFVVFFPIFSLFCNGLSGPPHVTLGFFDEYICFIYMCSPLPIS